MVMCTINSLEDTKTRRILLLQPVPKVGQTTKVVRRGVLSTVGNEVAITTYILYSIQAPSTF